MVVAIHWRTTGQRKLFFIDEDKQHCCRLQSHWLGVRGMGSAPRGRNTPRGDCAVLRAEWGPEEDASGQGGEPWSCPCSLCLLLRFAPLHAAAGTISCLRQSGAQALFAIVRATEDGEEREQCEAGLEAVLSAALPAKPCKRKRVTVPFDTEER